MLIHIGYHKTGTTWLQSAFFPHHPDLIVAGEYADLAEQFIYPDALDFDAVAARRFFQPRINEATTTRKVPILTTERLSGNPHSGGYDSTVIADRLHAAFPEARILIMVREQVDMAVSMYKQYVRMGGICKLREYLLPPLDGRIPLFRLRFLEYDRLSSYYVRLFGSDQVRVMAYEHFRDDPAAFLDQLCRFLGIRQDVEFAVAQRAHESQSDLATVLKCRVNRWHGGDSLYPVTPPFPWLTGLLFRAIERLDRSSWPRRFSVNLKQEASEILAGRYGSSNRSLAEAFGLDLQKYRYQMT